MSHSRAQRGHHQYPSQAHPSASSSAGTASHPRPPVQLSSSVTLSDAAQLVGRHSIIVSSESVVHPRARLDSSYGRIFIGRRVVVEERACLGAPWDPPFPSSSSTLSGAALLKTPATGPPTGGHVTTQTPAAVTATTAPLATDLSTWSARRTPVLAALMSPQVSPSSSLLTPQQQLSSSSHGLAVNIADFCLIETGAVIEPGCVIHDNVTVGAGSIVGAGTEIGRYSTIAPYSIIGPSEKIGEFTTVFAGGRIRRTDERIGTKDIRPRMQAKQIEVLKRMVKSDPSKFV